MAPIQSKRKNQGSNYPFKLQKDKNNGNGILRRIIPAQTATEVSKALLQQCFGILKEGIWWRVLPLEDMYDDVGSGIGIDWDYFLRLHISSGLLFTKTMKSSSKQYQIRRDLWHDITKA